MPFLSYQHQPWPKSLHSILSTPHSITPGIPSVFLPHYCTYHTIPVSIHLFAVVLTCYLFLLLLFDLLVLLLILLLMLPLVPFPFLLLMWLIQFTMITISKSFQQTRMTQSRQQNLTIIWPLSVLLLLLFNSLFGQGAYGIKSQIFISQAT